MTATPHTHCLTGYGVTHPGLQYFQNEDVFVIDEERQLYAVIDGVGGASAGEIAASIAEEVIRKAVFAQDDFELELRRVLVATNNEIIRQAALNPEWKGMGCVATLCCVREGKLWVAHVGDTRLYQITQDQIIKLTKDHSPVGELEDAGEITEDQALMHPYRNVVHRMLGAKMLNPEDDVWIDVAAFEIPAYTRFLLCSDGLTDLVSRKEIFDLVNERGQTAHQICNTLVTRANMYGGKDNITVVLLSPTAAYTPAQELFKSDISSPDKLELPAPKSAKPVQSRRWQALQKQVEEDEALIPPPASASPLKGGSVNRWIKQGTFWWGFLAGGMVMAMVWGFFHYAAYLWHFFTHLR